MVEASKRSRAKLAHKLAKYVRANPIHRNQGISPMRPSTTHLMKGGVQRRNVTNKAKTWYPADDEKSHFKRSRLQCKPCKGKAVEAGSVVILLSGKHRGRRVVVLKSFNNNTLLVTGPYCINGVPLKRVNRAYVIVTSTKVALGGVNTAIDEKFFKSFNKYRPCELKNASEARKKKVEELKKAQVDWKDSAKKLQGEVDKALCENIKKVEEMKGYLRTRFTLYNATRPHELKF